MTGTHSHGQGHDTTFTQIVADKLGVPIENIDLVHGDMGQRLPGMGLMVQDHLRLVVSYFKS